MVPKLLGVTPHRAAQDLGFYVLRQHGPNDPRGPNINAPAGREHHLMQARQILVLEMVSGH